MEVNPDDGGVAPKKKEVRRNLQMKLEEGTAATIKLAKGARDMRVWDTVCDGLFLRVHNTGRATYGVRYWIHGKPKTKTIRQVVPDVKGLALARKEAADIRAKAQLGQDLIAELAAARELANRPVITMGMVVDRYLKTRKPTGAGDVAADQDGQKRRKLRRLRPRSYEEVRRHLEVNLKGLHKLPIAEITRPKIVEVLDDVAEDKGGPTADAAKRALSKMFVWAINRGHRDDNPAMYIEPYGDDEMPKRKLTMAELVEVWHAAATLTNTAYGRIVRILILTGCRRSEVGDLDWAEVNEGEHLIALPASRAKNKREHLVPMSPQVLALLPARRNSTTKVFGRYDKEDGTGFGGWSKAKGELDEAILDARRKVDPKAQPMPTWRLHDLRHAFATLMHEEKFAGAPTGDKHLVELCLNHVSGTKGGIAGRYDASERLADRRKALDAWGAHVQSVVSVSADSRRAVPQARSSPP
jgi:integrase